MGVKPVCLVINPLTENTFLAYINLNFQKLYTVYSYQERWRDWPRETAATGNNASGAKSSRIFGFWKMRGKVWLP